jgi:hypothetical protein
MASGIASPWGLSTPMVGGLTNTLDFGSQHLTGELSLTSIAPTFDGNTFVSPLTVQNKSYYSAFGKGSALKRVNAQIKKVNSEISYLKRV